MASKLAAIPPNKMQQRRERKMFSTSDDTAMMKQVQATHAPDGREVDVKPILHIIEEILIHVIARTVDGDVDVILSLKFSFYVSILSSLS